MFAEGARAFTDAFTCTLAYRVSVSVHGRGTGTQLFGAAADVMGMLSFEKLDVFKVGAELRELVNEHVLPRATTEVRDQLDRCTASILLNIGEGAGRWHKKEKRRYYEFARGSAMEAAAILRLLQIDKRIDQQTYEVARNLVDRIVAMLTRLLQS